MTIDQLSAETDLKSYFEVIVLIYRIWCVMLRGFLLFCAFIDGDTVEGKTQKEIA